MLHCCKKAFTDSKLTDAVKIATVEVTSPVDEQGLKEIEKVLGDIPDHISQVFSELEDCSVRWEINEKNETTEISLQRSTNGKIFIQRFAESNA